MSRVNDDLPCDEHVRHGSVHIPKCALCAALHLLLAIGAIIPNAMALASEFSPVWMRINSNDCVLARDAG
jgi:hypothetical protein